MLSYILDKIKEDNPLFVSQWGNLGVTAAEWITKKQ